MDLEAKDHARDHARDGLGIMQAPLIGQKSVAFDTGTKES
jgi:hypothetical protein